MAESVKTDVIIVGGGRVVIVRHVVVVDDRVTIVRYVVVVWDEHLSRVGRGEATAEAEGEQQEGRGPHGRHPISLFARRPHESGNAARIRAMAARWGRSSYLLMAARAIQRPSWGR